MSTAARPELAVWVTNQGLLIREDEFLKHYSPADWSKLIKSLTVSHTTFVPRTKTAITSHITACKKIETRGSNWINDRVTYLLISRFGNLGQILQATRNIYRNRVAPGEVIAASALQPGVTLLANQQAAFDYLISQIYTPDRLKIGRGSCIFVMATGLGKTFIGGALIGHIARKTLIVVPQSQCIGEWIKMLGQCYPQLRVGQYHSKAPKTDGDVVIMTIRSATLNEFKWRGGRVADWSTYFGEFGMAIFDEVHNYATATREEIFWRAGFPYTIGLTATPDERADGMERVLHYHLGPLVRADNIPGFAVETIAWRGRVRAIRYHGPPEFTRRLTNKNDIVSVAMMCRQFIADHHRNALLIAEIRKIYEAGHNVFVFSYRRDNVEELSRVLRESGIVHEAPEVATLMGGSSESDKSASEARARIIVMTYGYGIEGLSIPKMDAIVLATPRKGKMRQAIGRILRRSGDPSVERVIIDIIDEETSLRSQFSARKKVYLEKEFAIEYSEVHCDGDDQGSSN
jgi:superfamily II DNA or RNA helicase